MLSSFLTDFFLKERVFNPTKERMKAIKQLPPKKIHAHLIL
ncbi:hypothetical protein DR8_27200 [Helicobacter pylori]